MLNPSKKGSLMPSIVVIYLPGLRISGAISLAFEEVNANKLKSYGHELEFLITETFGEEVTSIRQTANLWTKNISGYIGPQETCVHEGRMAAAFNLPMISYVSVCLFFNFNSIKYFFCSFVPITKRRTRRISRHLHVRDHPISKLRNLLSRCCWLTIGHK